MHPSRAHMRVCCLVSISHIHSQNMEQHPIKNLLFDLGGVIVDIRRTNCVEAFLKLGFNNIADFLGDYGQKGPFLLIEEGNITPDEFRAEVRRHIPGNVTDAQIDTAFNAFIIGIPRHRLEALRQLRAQGYKLYVISNTNHIMWTNSIAQAFAQEGGTVEDYFDGIVTSFSSGCCKPQRPIFEKVINDFSIIPQETVFFDDSKENCLKGEELGFRSVHVAPGTEFINLIPQ